MLSYGEGNGALIESENEEMTPVEQRKRAEFEIITREFLRRLQVERRDISSVSRATEIKKTNDLSSFVDFPPDDGIVWW